MGLVGYRPLIRLVILIEIGGLPISKVCRMAAF